MNGELIVTGDGSTGARMEIGGTINIATAGEAFRFGPGAGDAFNTNRLVGGTISGPGSLTADTGLGLFGFGQISAPVNFINQAKLFAIGGTLTITGTIADVGNIGTADPSGILNITNPWNTNVANQQVLMVGGILQGSTITNDFPSGIDGFGEVTARLINNTRADAIGGTLLLSNNANDLDGSTGNGTLHAQDNGVLEVRFNATKDFTGTVSADTGGKVYASDEALRFLAASDINLNNGTYHAIHVTEFFGTITVAAASESLMICPPGLRFRSGSNTVLNGDLRLRSNIGSIDSGAIFSGGGKLINQINMRIADAAQVGVLLENEGTLELAVDAAAQITGVGFQQEPSGRLVIDLGGTGVNDFDSWSLTGAAQLAGTLDVSLLGGFNPSLGNTFTILSAVGGISGTFGSVIAPALSPGLSMRVQYNPLSVVLQIAQGSLADLNGDGSVDAADAGIMFGNWGLTGSGDINGDGIVDAADAGVMFGEWTGDSSSQSAHSVPEPAAWSLLLIGLGLLAPRRRRVTHACPYTT